MNIGTYRIPYKKLERFMRDVLIKTGVPAPDAGVVAAVLIAADLKGFDSHGISRLYPIYYSRIKERLQEPRTKLEIVREKDAVTVMDGHNGMGHVIAKRAMLIAMKKAARYGLGMTVVRNSTHYGIAGYYVEMASQNDMIGITGTNARPSIAPTFGVENMLGTNPLTFGIPTSDPFPFILDCATSTAQRGKIEVYDRMGLSLPEGWVIDSKGKTRTDTHKILEDLSSGKAALTPLGGIGEKGAGYKGYGYATVVEILSAALQEGGFLKALSGIKLGKKVPIPIGHFFIAIDIAHFLSPFVFRKTTGTILTMLRASQKAPGQKRIFTAGEKEYISFISRKKQGIPLDKSIMKEMLLMRNELKLPDKFDFEKGL